MHEQQSQRGRGRGGSDRAARRGSNHNFHTNAHLSQNPYPTSSNQSSPNSGSYSESHISGAVPAYAPGPNPWINHQTSYNTSAQPVPPFVTSSYTSVDWQQRVDQLVRLDPIALPIRGRVKSTKTDEHHKFNIQTTQAQYSGRPAQAISQPSYYGSPAQVSVQSHALPIRNHPKNSLESSKVSQSNPGDSQHNNGWYYSPTQQTPVIPASNPNMSYPYDNSQYNYAPGSAYQYPQQGQQSYDQNPPAIRNPFPAPPPARNAYGAQNAGYDPEQDALLAQWNSQYAPADVQAMRDARSKAENPNTTQVGPRPGAAAAVDSQPANPEKKVTVVRKGGGQVWEDNTLLEWDPTQFRIMVGNLAGEVTDDSLAKAFAQYGVSKARVIRDKRTTKSKGFGFVSFTDGELGFKAAREMVGKYIGSHPVTIQRSKTDLKPVVQKDKYKGKGKNNKNNNRNDKKEKKKEDDPLRAHTGAVIEKKPVKNAGGYKVIG